MDNTRMSTPNLSAVTDQPFKSKLQEGPERFLAHAIEHGLQHGRRTAKDFIRHFPPATIMEGLEDEPQLRANILVMTTGVRMKVALKKSATSCGSDLQIALDEHETDTDTVVRMFDPDDRVRFLDSRALWRFVTEGDFWQVDAKKDPKAHAIAAAHIGYLIERALEDQLLTHRDVVKGVTVESMVNLLPRSELPKIISGALELGQANRPFLDENLLDAIGIPTLTAHIPLAAIWNQVVVPFIAEPHGLARKADEPATLERSQPIDLSRSRPVEATVPTPVSQVAQNVVARPATFSVPSKAAPPPSDDSGLDLGVDELLGSLASGKVPPKRPARRPGSVPPTA